MGIICKILGCGFVSFRTPQRNESYCEFSSGVTGPGGPGWTQTGGGDIEKTHERQQKRAHSFTAHQLQHHLSPLYQTNLSSWYVILHTTTPHTHAPPTCSANMLPCTPNQGEALLVRSAPFLRLLSLEPPGLPPSGRGKPRSPSFPTHRPLCPTAPAQPCPSPRTKTVHPTLLCCTLSSLFRANAHVAITTPTYPTSNILLLSPSPSSSLAG